MHSMGISFLDKSKVEYSQLILVLAHHVPIVVGILPPAAFCFEIPKAFWVHDSWAPNLSFSCNLTKIFENGSFGNCCSRNRVNFVNVPGFLYQRTG